MIMEHKRIAAWWYSLEDLYWPSVDGKEKIKRTAEALAASKADTAILYGCHFRWDWMPYFTILHDYLATIAEELHSYNIKLFDHHSVNLVHRYSTVEEMRHCIIHSGPHIPFSPDREAAASFTYHGKKLNDWRMIDVDTKKPLLYPQYSGEGFCYRNPDFIESYLDYAKRLVADTKIDGLMADDAVHYMHMHSCACPHCLKAFKEKTGIDLPPASDQLFWGNFENKAFLAWLDLRNEASGNFYEKLRAVLPDDFTLTACGNDSARATSISMGADVRQFLKGCNYANLELVGNTPPYFPDKITTNQPMVTKIAGASLHAGVARERGVSCFGTGYGFSKDSANIIWAVNKFLGADCYMSTLKPRLGLPKDELGRLPKEAELVKDSFTFEAAHPELFSGDSAAEIAVYFSYETRNHSLFGGAKNGFAEDFSKTLQTLLTEGIFADTVAKFPQNAEHYKIIIVPSAYKFTDAEQEQLAKYLQAGGKVYANGPCGIQGVKSPWSLPGRPDCGPKEFFSTIRDGVWFKPADWVENTTFETPKGDYSWVETSDRLFYNPHRIENAGAREELIKMLKTDLGSRDVEILDQHGYFISAFKTEKEKVFHFLAAEFDTQIDQHLDEIRFHRSRVNLITKATPKNVKSEILIRAKKKPVVYLPFGGSAEVLREDGNVRIHLPENTSYAIIQFDLEDKT